MPVLSPTGNNVVNEEPGSDFSEVKRYRRRGVSSAGDQTSSPAPINDLLPVTNKGQRPPDLLDAVTLSKKELLGAWGDSHRPRGMSLSAEDSAEGESGEGLVDLLLTVAKMDFEEFVCAIPRDHLSLRSFLWAVVGAAAGVETLSSLAVDGGGTAEAILAKHRGGDSPYGGPCGSLGAYVLWALEPQQYDRQWRNLLSVRVGDEERRFCLRAVCRRYERAWLLTPLLLASKYGPERMKACPLNLLPEELVVAIARWVA